MNATLEQAPPTTLPLSREVHYPDAMDVGSAVREHLTGYGLGDGGYDDDWVSVRIGWLPLVFPNTRARKKAIRAHDLHHVVGNYNAYWKEGELDVSAWELGAGGPGSFLMGWAILLGAFISGLVLRPRAIWEAFLRGRRARNLFGTTIDPSYYALSVGELRAQLDVVDETPGANAADLGAFAGYFLAGLGYVAGLLATGGAFLAGLAWLGLHLMG